MEQYIVYGLYALSAFFFVLITKKCFLEKLTLPKVFFVVLLSPAVGQVVTNVLINNVDYEENFDKLFLLRVATVFTLSQLIIQLVSMLFYIKLTKSNTPAISMFVYMCATQILPNCILMSLATIVSYTACACFAALHILFYFLAIIPLSEFKNTKQLTDTKLLVVLPILTYIFNCAMAVMVFLSFIYDDLILKEFIRIDFDSIVSNADKTHFTNMLEYLDKSAAVHMGFMIYPCIFVTAILIIAFYVIVKNIKYKNIAEEEHRKVKILSVEVMEALARTIDAKDEYTKGHSIRVANYSKMIAEKMGLTKRECEDIYYMGLLHDIGKIGVPNEIINKPSRLTDEEYEIIKTHPILGFNILSEIKSRPDLATGARWHHERYDGKGYPDKENGAEIPMEARIIAVADSYDAMTSNRSYRNYLPQDVVREEIEKNIGTQFDEVAAKCMLSIIDEDKDYSLHE